MKLFINFLNFFFRFIWLFHKNKIVDYLKRQIKPKIIFDVGAYRGKFGHSFENCKVFFFEPNSESFKKIKKKKNNKYFNIGLGSKFQKKFFYILPNDSASSINRQKVNSQFKDIILKFLGGKKNKTNINIYPLNFFINKYSIKVIDILKIDTEGYENEVLKGISKKNYEKIKYIVVEKCLNENLYDNYSFESIKKNLQKNNFIFLKKFKDPIWNYEDYIYKNKRLF